MKLAEALILRADCQKRVEQLRRRLTRNAKVQEGETPAEDPQGLLTELDTTLSELTGLITRINRTNAQTTLGEVGTISDAIAQRDTLRLQRSVYSSLVETASYTAPRYGRAEIKDLSTVDLA